MAEEGIFPLDPDSLCGEKKCGVPPSSLSPDITVLYVDDDSEAAIFFKTFLEKTSPLHVLTSGNGPEVFTLLSQNRFDAIVSDYSMPGMNGIELLKAVRISSPQIPFILFTGKGREEVVMEAINNGATFYLQKTGDPQTLFVELAHKIRTAVRNQRAELALRESEEKYRLLFESSRDGILIIRDDRVIDSNTQAGELFDLRKGELKGRTILELSPELQPDGTSSEVLWQSVSSGVVSGTTGLGNWKFKGGDAVTFYAEIGLNRIDLDGAICIHMVIRDITVRLLAEEELSRRNSELTAACEELKASEDERCSYLKEVISNQEKIRESEQRYRELADLLPLIVYECDLKGTITYVNRQGFLTFHYPPDSLLPDLNVLDLIIPEDRPLAITYISQLQGAGESVPHEYRAYRHDGAIIPVVIYSSPIKKDGLTIGFRGIVLDISERKQSEEAIRESERRLANVIDFLPDATFVIDSEGKVIAWNRAMEQLTGSAASDFLGKGDYAYSVPFYGTRRPILIDIALQADSENEKLYAAMDWIGDTVVGEAYMPNLGNGTTYLWGTATPLRDSRGAIVGAIESIRDITERKRTQDELIRAREELEIRVDERTAELTHVNASLQSEIDERILAEIALRESQERYRRLVELSPDAIFVHDGEEIVFVNTAGIRLLGAKDDRRIVGAGISEIVNLETSGTPVSSGIMGNSKDPGQTFEEEFTRLDHSAVAVEVSSAPIVYKGTPAVLVVARDITERRKAEEQLRQHAAEMTEKNKELDFLTNQLLDMNQDLDLRVRKRTEQVIRLMKQKDEFITQIGHDLKTPLTPLRALLPSLIEDEKSPEIRDSMTVLLRSVHSIQEQTDKILTIARLNREDIMAKPEEVILFPILHESIQKNWLLVQKKSLDVTIDIPDDLSVLCSHGDATVIFDNIIGNAMKYSREDGSIWIRSSEDGERICVQVKDDGIGLSPEETEHVFEEFYMADSSRHDRSSSGLGLAIVSRLIGLYRGIVRVESEGKGKGATFSVCLPAPHYS